jgi:hypothetical protein
MDDLYNNEKCKSFLYDEILLTISFRFWALVFRLISVFLYKLTPWRTKFQKGLKLM